MNLSIIINYRYLILLACNAFFLFSLINVTYSSSVLDKDLEVLNPNLVNQIKKNNENAKLEEDENNEDETLKENIEKYDLFESNSNKKNNVKKKIQIKLDNIDNVNLKITEMLDDLEQKVNNLDSLLKEIEMNNNSNHTNNDLKNPQNIFLKELESKNLLTEFIPEAKVQQDISQFLPNEIIFASTRNYENFIENNEEIQNELSIKINENLDHAIHDIGFSSFIIKAFLQPVLADRELPEYISIYLKWLNKDADFRALSIPARMEKIFNEVKKLKILLNPFNTTIEDAGMAAAKALINASDIPFILDNAYSTLPDTIKPCLSLFLSNEKDPEDVTVYFQDVEQPLCVLMILAKNLNL